MLIRKLPEVSTIVYSKTQTYEAESVGAQKTVVTKSDEWKETYADHVSTHVVTQGPRTWFRPRTPTGFRL